jgi:hypothetical protein
MAAGRLGGGGCWGAQAPPMALHMQAHFDGLQITLARATFFCYYTFAGFSPWPPNMCCETAATPVANMRS